MGKLHPTPHPGSEAIMVVAGLGRCGTSLVMQMLDAAGLPVVVGEGPPAYEDSTQIGLVRDSGRYREAAAWLGGLGGQFVKMLDPFRMTLPPLDYRVLWLDRDDEEQAKSQAKFMHLLLGQPELPPVAIRALRRQLTKDRQASFRLWRRLGVVPTVVRFEHLLLAGSAVATVAEWAGVPDRYREMERVIVPRPLGCLDGLLEARLPFTRPWAVTL